MMADADLLTGCVPSDDKGTGPAKLPHPVPPQQKAPVQALLEEFENEVHGLLTRQQQELRKQLRALVVRTSTKQHASTAGSVRWGTVEEVEDFPPCSEKQGEDCCPCSEKPSCAVTINTVEEAEEVEPRCTSASPDVGHQHSPLNVSWHSPNDARSPRPAPATTPKEMPSHTRTSMDTYESGRVRTGNSIMSTGSSGASLSDKEVSKKALTRLNTSFNASMALKRKAERGNDWRATLLRMTQHWGYEVLNAVVIFINAILIAWESQFKADQVPVKASASHFDAFMVVFCLIFLVDLVIRVLAQGLRFFYSNDWKWNLFDVFVVVGSLVELVAFIMQTDSAWLSNSSLLRVLRLVRVARIVKALRSIVYFRDLRITISMLCEAMVPLMTVIVIMCMVWMVFAIFFTDGASAYMVDQNEKHEGLTKFYGGLFITMATLFQAISGGIDWGNAADPLKHLPPVYTAAFYVYVAFSVFAMLNVVSAMFIDNTLQRSKNDREFVVQTQIQGKKEFMATMDKLFTELDPDASGTIRLHELQERINDTKVSAFFQAIDINIYKVKRMFQLMDVDKSGDIDRGEFRKGCDRLRGDAKELDLAILQYEMRTVTGGISTIKSMLKKVSERLDC